MSFAPIFGGFGSGGTTADPWTPADLFTGGEDGAWFEAADLSTLFQDTAGSTAVTADGDPIGRWEDKSGNGNHLTQGTSGERPLYKTAGGLHWVLFDGGNDRMSSGSLASQLFAASAGALAVAYEATNAEHVGHLIGEQLVGTDFRRTNMSADTRSSPNRFGVSNNGGGDNLINYLSEQPADVRTAILNNEGGTLKGYHNGSVLASTAAVQVLSGTTRLDVGWQQGSQGSFNHQGKIFALVALDRTLTAQEITDLTAYLKGQAGI